MQTLSTPTLASHLRALIVFMFVMLWIGTAAFRALERRVRMLGTLGQH
jgi:hypothetical protein